MNNPKPIYVKLLQIPELYGLSRYSIYRAEKDAKLTIHRGTGVNLVKVADLESLIEGKAA
ncbi:helix-turn-helix transcriptional regulator [Ruegeria atlantica]|uniref:helix-turn-helix transcriptional regulator n=1 Tax=Ruegeria atlantica TaxID=81569 RepID=UPI00147B03F9|nr:hypothetical protein [Ruegeria atlantica]